MGLRFPASHPLKRVVVDQILSNSVSRKAFSSLPHNPALNVGKKYDTRRIAYGSMLNMMTYFRILLLSFSIGIVILVGCGSETNHVIVTPTPNETLIAAESDPFGTGSVAQQATASPTQTDIPMTPLRFIGPVVGTDYVSPTPNNQGDPFDAIPSITPTPPASTPIPLATGTPGPTPTPVPGLDAAQMGLQLYSNMGFDDWMRVIGLTEQTGVEWVKVQVNWAFLQPSGPNEFGEPFQLFERQIEALKRAEFNVLLSVAKAPAWARSVQQESGPPDDPAQLAAFLTFMLDETKIGGVTDAIEVWNEPNLIREWQGTLPFNGSGYMQLFTPAYNAIRAYSPTMTIVTAGLAPTGSIGTFAVDDRLFLQQMYNAGLANYGADVVVGIHPYSWGNAPDLRCCDVIAGRGWDDDPHFFFINNLEDTRAIMLQNGHDVQLWVTEFGWATWEGLSSAPPEEWVTYNSAQDQANYGIRAFEIGQDLPYVGPMLLWNLNFANAFTVENSQEIAGYSIINPTIFPSERPLYWAMAQATGALNP